MTNSYIWGRGALLLGGVQIEAGMRGGNYLCGVVDAACFRTTLYALGAWLRCRKE